MKKPTNPWMIIGWIVVASFVLCGGGCGAVLVITALGSTVTTTTTTQVAEPVSTTAPSATTGAPVTTSGASAACTPATTDDVAPIQATFEAPAATIGEAYVATSGDLTYLGANIYDAGGVKVSSADVWVKTGGAWYALSGGARDATEMLPDGRDLPGAPSAGDDTGLSVQACATS